MLSILFNNDFLLTKKNLMVIFLVNMILVVPFTIYVYCNINSNEEQETDAKMLAVAKSLSLFYNDYHDLYSQKTPVNPNKYEYFSIELDHMFSSINIVTISTLINDNGVIRYTSNSNPPEFFAHGNKHSFLDPIKYPSVNIVSVFESGSPKYMTFYDNSEKYRTLLYPTVSLHGLHYIIAIDSKAQQHYEGITYIWLDMLILGIMAIIFSISLTIYISTKIPITED